MLGDAETETETATDRSAPQPESGDLAGEPDMFSVWLGQLLRGQWPVLVTCAGAGLVAAMVYTLSVTPAFSSEWVLEVGKLGEWGYIESPEAVALRIGEATLATPCTATTDVLEAPDELVVVTTICSTAADAFATAKQLGASVLDRHGRLFDEATQNQRAHHDFLEQEVEGLGPADTSDVELALRRLWLLRDNQAERFRLKASLSSAFSYRTELIRSPRKPAAPAHPARALVVVGLIAGLVSGLMVATLRQALRRP